MSCWQRIPQTCAVWPAIKDCVYVEEKKNVFLEKNETIQVNKSMYNPNQLKLREKSYRNMSQSNLIWTCLTQFLCPKQLFSMFGPMFFKILLFIL